MTSKRPNPETSDENENIENPPKRLRSEDFGAIMKKLEEIDKDIKSLKEE